jgi:hypothetical protein
MSKDRGFRSRIAKERGLVTKQRARTHNVASSRQATTYATGDTPPRSRMRTLNGRKKDWFGRST